jgi:hypothetical protein
MIPTTARYAPNSPQTPARQTAPAAQRQGFTLALLGKKGIGQKTLDGWNLMEPVTTLEEGKKANPTNSRY